jgi:hypothetical protein
MYIKDFQRSFTLIQIMTVADILKLKFAYIKLKKIPTSHKKIGLYYQHKAFNNFCGKSYCSFKFNIYRSVHRNIFL